MFIPNGVPFHLFEEDYEELPEVVPGVLSPLGRTPGTTSEQRMFTGYFQVLLPLALSKTAARGEKNQQGNGKWYEKQVRDKAIHTNSFLCVLPTGMGILQKDAQRKE